MRCRTQHSMAFQIPSASLEACKCSIFPQTIRDWNDLPDSLISSAEMSDDSGSFRGSPNGTIGKFTNGTIGSQWCHWWKRWYQCTIGGNVGTGLAKSRGIYEYFPSRRELLVNPGTYLGNTGYSGKFIFHDNQKSLFSKLGLILCYTCTYFSINYGT